MEKSNEGKKKGISYCFQKGEGNRHKLYIYDDVTAYGRFQKQIPLNCILIQMVVL